MRKQLKRDAAREELIRKEESARTVEQFREIIHEWNTRDKNRERRERYHERSVYTQMLDWDTFDERAHVNEEFADLICYCVCEMHQIVGDKYISTLINKATKKQKEVFFAKILCGCSTLKIAECYGMTDRNVRKLLALMIGKIQEKLWIALLERPVEWLTFRQKRFLEMYEPSDTVNEPNESAALEDGRTDE